ncbi:MAG: tetratricopeptide repeat protein [bacterium]
MPAHLGLCEVLHEFGARNEMIKSFETAATYGTRREARLFNNLGIRLRRSKDFGLALRTFDLASLLDPSDPVFLYNKALVYIAHRQFETALVLLGRSLEIDPGFIEGKNTAEKVEMWIHARKPRGEEAE